MLEFDGKSNLLEQANYKYQLQDVDEPNLYRELYEYSQVPKIAFNHRVVPLHMPEEIWITDTTFRDGQQSTSPFTVDQIVRLFQLLSRLGGPKGIVRQSEFFLYTEKDKQAVRKCQELGLEFPEITSWIRANEKDFELVKEMGLQETGILVSCSDYHIFKKMHMTRRQAMDKYLGIVRAALDNGIRPRCHFEDITRADFYGFVVPFATELMNLAKESGIRIKIRACDTLGYGVSYPRRCAAPVSVPGIIYGLRHYADVPSELAGMARPQRFLQGRDQRRRGLALRLLVGQLRAAGHRRAHRQLPAGGHGASSTRSLRGTHDGMDFTAITDIAEFFEKDIGYADPAAHAVCRPQLQRHPRGHPRRRAAQG